MDRDKAPDVSFVSPLKPEDVTLLLHKELSHSPPRGFFTLSPILRSRALAGSIDANGFRIGRLQMYSTNPGERELRLVISLEGEGSRIDGWWRLTTFQRTALFVFLIMVITSFFGNSSEIAGMILSLICGLPLFGVLLRWPGASGERQLETQLRDLLQRPASTALLHG